MALIVMLDDIGKAFYKKLKLESDSLLKIRSDIKCKQKIFLALTEEWLELEKSELDDAADAVYHQKNKLEIELQKLFQDEKASLKRIAQYANPKT